VAANDGTASTDSRASAVVPPIRLQDGEQVILAFRRTGWYAILCKYASLGLYLPWWRAGWIVLTDRRLIIRAGVLNRGERGLPLHFVQDATVHRSWLGLGTISVSTAGGGYGSVGITDLKPEHARRLADAVMLEAKRAAVTYSSQRHSSDAVTDALARLVEMRDSGALTEDEFAQQKTRLLQQEG
jgi:uncharacterized membrane protein YdbT with pleckstrin-like domain